MTLDALFRDKTSRGKAKVKVMVDWLTDGSLPVDELLAFADSAKDPVLGSCLEAVESLSAENPSRFDASVLAFAVQSLSRAAPCVKWESAKVIGNLAAFFPDRLESATERLLENAKHQGTVVRWAMAYALGKILKTTGDAELRERIERLCELESNNGVKQKYRAGLP